MNNNNPSDKVYIPLNIVDEILSEILPYLKEEATILEPFYGEGAFFNKLPNNTEWCEIDKGRDFFEYDGRVDWIITNPPYSIFSSVLPKMLEVADNIVMLIPVNKLLCSMPRMMDIVKAGSNIRQIHFVGSGRQVGFPFGFPCAAVWVQRGYEEDVKYIYSGRCCESKKKNYK